ncbi:MAG: hypothetical protein AB7P31_13595 [Steroidobacteraceae bacterium]
MNDSELEREWRVHATDLPSAHVDHAIRAAARRALPRRPAWRRYLPLAAAASVGVVAFLLVRQAPGPVQQMAAPAVARAPAVASAPEATVALEAPAKKTMPAERAQARVAAPMSKALQAESAEQVTDGALPALLATLVKADVARRVGIDPGEVTIVAYDAVTWSDGALGCRKPGEMAIQVLVPGYRIVAVAAGKRYTYHTDTHAQVRLCEGR